MDLLDSLQELSKKILRSKDVIQNEEATKQAYIIPFISALGYDVYDPLEVVPEFTSDVGIKKGEKVDYAIMIDGDPMILMECKWCGADLNVKHESQLFRYFSATKAKIGLLTNGIIYRFFTDLEKPNQMDDRPFLEFNILDFHESQIKELKKFSKSGFSIDDMISIASELKYTREIKFILSEQINSPEDDFTRFFAKKVYSGLMTKSVLAKFKDITQRAFKQYINDVISEKFSSVLENREPVSTETSEIKEESKPDTSFNEEIFFKDGDIVTTREEIEAYSIVKSILRKHVDISRVEYRDVKSYFSVLLDNNNRKPICKFEFTNSKKCLVLYDKSESIENKTEEKVQIEKIDDIYNYEDRIVKAVNIYDGKISENE